MAASGQDALPVCSTATPRQVLEMSKRRRDITFPLLFSVLVENRRVFSQFIEMFFFLEKKMEFNSF